MQCRLTELLKILPQFLKRLATVNEKILSPWSPEAQCFGEASSPLRWERKHCGPTEDLTAPQMSASGKKTGQIYLREKPSVSDLESSSLAGLLALIRSNLCTRS